VAVQYGNIRLRSTNGLAWREKRLSAMQLQLRESCMQLAASLQLAAYVKRHLSALHYSQPACGLQPFGYSLAESCTASAVY